MTFQRNLVEEGTSKQFEIKRKEIEHKIQTPLLQQSNTYCTHISNTVHSPSPPISKRTRQTRKDAEW